MNRLLPVLALLSACSAPPQDVQEQTPFVRWELEVGAEAGSVLSAVLSSGVLSPEQRQQLLKAGWESGELIAATSIFADQWLFDDANALVADYARQQIRDAVADPAVAEALWMSSATPLPAVAVAAPLEPAARATSMLAAPRGSSGNL